MGNWRLLVAYEGTRFCGWQRQSHGVAIQALIEEALRSILGKRAIVYGASRTDSGVHALGQVAHFQQPGGTREFSSYELLKGLNAKLPPQVRVLRLKSVSAKFHAQFYAKGKHYRYRIYHGRIFPPLELNRMWHCVSELDWEAMQAAAPVFIGRHDFHPFSAVSRSERKNKVREIKRLDLIKKGAEIRVDIEGDGFLYKMVRLIVGTLVQVGRGRCSKEEIQRRLRSRAREQDLLAAPAHGLYLMKVFY
ncbi:MAG: tRNA pseudouridine(38-40) synthase TruA [Verrucomicrobiae bacterium]|nr:tRNA pseudouridine(38-40) synthase TruA [Verrucomicrobiae bacterium]